MTLVGMFAATGLGAVEPSELFATSEQCLACHNGLVTPSGEDVSIGSSWRASMMANAARDPYWQAAVRREVLDYPQAQSQIEDECSTCHMPMYRYAEHARGGSAEIFAHLPLGASDERAAKLAADGVSCSLCHQIDSDRLGESTSFNGGFSVDPTPATERTVFGPYAVDDGVASVMLSATGFQPREASHVQSSELCATCHTLYTHALGEGAKEAPRFPEQVPYLEWQHSSYAGEASCQSCHMPVIDEPVAISSVLGEARESVSRHVFRGGNFFVPLMLARWAGELGVTAPAAELEALSRATRDHLSRSSARIRIESVGIETDRLRFDVAIDSLAGHKLPTAYPSRRVWLHVAIRDGESRLVFESGRLGADGSIHGNDNDHDPAAYEPHYRHIDDEDEVQIYESVLADAAGAVTTGLLSAVRYVKDNRILPRGFDKTNAPSDVTPHGDAADDPDFLGGGDRVTYEVRLSQRPGPFAIEAELLYQPIAFRWARNLGRYNAAETRRFVDYWNELADRSATLLASDRALGR